MKLLRNSVAGMRFVGRGISRFADSNLDTILLGLISYGAYASLVEAVTRNSHYDALAGAFCLYCAGRVFKEMK